MTGGKIISCARGADDTRDFGRVASVLMPIIMFLMIAFTLRTLWASTNTLVGMYANIDGQWAAWNLQGIVDWGRPFDLSPFNPLAGMGTLFLPNLPWLNPGAWPFFLSVEPATKYAASYSIYLVELVASSYVLFRVIGGRRLHSFIAVQILFFFLPPFSAVLNVLSWNSLAPVNMHLVSMCNVGLAALLKVGESNWRRDALWGFAFFAAAMSAIYSGPMTLLTYIPVYGIFFALLTVGRNVPWPVVFSRLSAVFLVSLVFWAAGVGEYILTTSHLSARSLSVKPFLYPGWDLFRASFWIQALENLRYCDSQRSQYLICPGRRIAGLQLLALVGAVAIAFQVRSLRLFAIGYIAFVAAIHVLVLAWMIELIGPLSAINPAFYSWAATTFLVFFAAFLPVAALDWLIPRPRIAGVLLAAVPIAMWAAWNFRIAPTQPKPSPGSHWSSLLPPPVLRNAVTTGPLYDALLESIAIDTENPVFRGRAAMVVAPRDDGWLAQATGTTGNITSVIASRHHLYQTFGSSFQETDLWSVGVPTFDEYGQWVSVPVATFTSKLLATRLESSFLRVFRADAEILRALGVNHLITDAYIDDPEFRLVAEQSSPQELGSMRLYFLDGANLATYSPTSIVQADTMAGALDFIAANRNNLRVEGVATETAESALVPARDSELAFTRDGWTLHAVSEGRSVIAVPIQFSHCWSVADPPPELRLYRGNAVQTFVEFEGEIDIQVRLHFGPFQGMDCRLRDVDELRKLEVR